MIEDRYPALIAEMAEDGTTRCRIGSCRTDDLPPGELLIQVDYSSINYKDTLSARGKPGVTKQYPHTPGIDAAGTILHSDDPAWSVGQNVIVTGFDLGMNTPGGFGRYIRVPSGWAVPVPSEMDTRWAMMLGTAGLTAGLSVHHLIEGGVTPEKGPILVSGATGGVGGIAVTLLKKLDYNVVAINGRQDATTYLMGLGANTIISREEAIDDSGRPLLRSRWAGAIDAVGGDILTTMLKTVQPQGVVTCCGNAASHHLSTSVYPFILNGIRLIGIDSANCPLDQRRAVWQHLATDWRTDRLTAMVRTVDLQGLDAAIEDQFGRSHTGRVLVDLTG